jgi:hypothetical protein
MAQTIEASWQLAAETGRQRDKGTGRIGETENRGTGD